MFIGSGTLPEREHPQRVQFTVETMPRGLRERYDALEPPPDFSRIDALLPPEVLEKEGPSSQKFSHPGLFLDQWAQEELRKMEELKRRRHEEREERRRRRKALPKRERKPVPKVEAPPLIAEDQAPPVESAPVTPATREERPTIEIPEEAPPVVPPPTIDNSPSARESEDYARFARMLLRMGVPKQAVAAKMQAEGLDPLRARRQRRRQRGVARPTTNRAQEAAAAAHAAEEASSASNAEDSGAAVPTEEEAAAAAHAQSEGARHAVRFTRSHPARRGAQGGGIGAATGAARERPAPGHQEWAGRCGKWSESRSRGPRGGACSAARWTRSSRCARASARRRTLSCRRGTRSDSSFCVVFLGA